VGNGNDDGDGFLTPLPPFPRREVGNGNDDGDGFRTPCPPSLVGKWGTATMTATAS
jgi:hypothetical protein